MPRTVAVGVQDFSKIIENNYFYIDKTSFIKEWWDNGDTVTLITRPRRFGKTLTMSMADYFFSVTHADKSGLFKNLQIWKEKKFQALQGAYPVIFLSFANIKGSDFATVKEKIYQQIVNLYADHRYLVDSGFLRDEDAAFYKRVSVNMNYAVSEASLGQLSRYLYMYYGKNVILLLDEYDTPMQEAYVHQYWEELTGFMRGLLNAAFKTNLYLERGLMTGVTRVSKESIFSELNHLEVITTTSRKYATVFGFTGQEVFQALEEYGLLDQAAEVKQWYDGFRFGDCDHVYNPWSVIKFLDEREIAPYWENTSSNALVGRLIQKSSPYVKRQMEDLLQGRNICMAIDEQIVFDQLDRKESAIWSLLLASGYLKAVTWKTNNRGKKECVLDLANAEVRVMFEDLFTEWFSVCSSSYHDFIKALLMNDTENMNIFINKITKYTISFFDTGKKPSDETEPERFYHGLILGLMVDLENRYRITSNRESGFGRYDVLLEPENRTDDGIILEFKVMNPKKEKNLKETVQSAIRQIIDKKYAVTLEQTCDRDRIRIYGFAFSGKKVLIDGGYLSAYDSSGAGKKLTR